MSAKLVSAILIACALLISRGQSADTNATPSQTGPAGKDEAGRQKRTSTVVQHFWFDYKAQPNPGRRVWVHVDDSTWTELYPNGNQSRYKTGDRTTIQGMSGIAVRKVAGDPNQTWTLNDGSFEVFIPDKDSPRLILAFRHFQDGRWTKWQALALIHPIE